jgi:prefoldin beta subunit
MDKETQKNIQELQALEQNLHNILMQKQAFQLEINETTNALEEIKGTKDEVYKITGSRMLKTEKNKVLKELEERKKILELRLSTIEKQENAIESKAEQLKEQTKKSFESKK